MVDLTSNCGSSVITLHLRATDLKIVVSLPASNISWILGIEFDLPSSQVDALNVKHLRIALVHLHENCVRGLPPVGNDIHTNLVKRRQVFRLFRRNVGLIKAPVFISAKILRVKNVLIV